MPRTTDSPNFSSDVPGPAINMEAEINEYGVTHLVDSQSLPFNIAQLFGISESQFVCGKQDVHLELLVRGAELILPDNLSGRCCSNVSDDVDVGGPCGKLGLPCSNGGKRNDDKERTILLHFVEEIGKEGDSLNSLKKKKKKEES